MSLRPQLERNRTVQGPPTRRKRSPPRGDGAGPRADLSANFQERVGENCKTTRGHSPRLLGCVERWETACDHRFWKREGRGVLFPSDFGTAVAEAAGA